MLLIKKAVSWTKSSRNHTMFDVIVKTDSGKKSEEIRCSINHCTIGKSRENLVQIRGWRVANVHAELEQTEKGIFVIDKSDGVGLQVNGERANYYGPLRSSDQIEIANYTIKVGLTDGNEAAQDEVAAEVRKVENKAVET